MSGTASGGTSVLVAATPNGFFHGGLSNFFRDGLFWMEGGWGLPTSPLPSAHRPWPFSEIELQDSLISVLTSEGRVFRTVCRMQDRVFRGTNEVQTRPNCGGWESMPWTPGPVRDYSLLPDGTVIGVGADGLALAWRAKGFALESVPAEAENSSLWGVAATKEGLVNAIGDRVVLERDSTGRWSTVRGLPERRGWVGLGFAVALNGDLVVSEGFSEQRSTTGILVWGRSPEEGDDLPMARLSWPETGLARAGTVKIHMLPDGRFVAGAGFPEEPGVGGYLHVWRPPIREDHFERVDLPHHMDITDLDDNGEYLYVAGGSGIVRIPLDSLPFAETAKH